MSPNTPVRGASYRRPALMLALLLLFPAALRAQTLNIHDAVRTYSTLQNTTVTMTGRAELRITGSGDPVPGCVFHLHSPDAWLLMSQTPPSQVASTFLGRVRVNGANAVLNGNCRVVQYAQGAVVIPQGPEFAPLEVFDGRYFTGPSRRLNSWFAYNDGSPGAWATVIGSFTLKRGYMATFAQEEDGTGISKCYVAQDGDLEVGRLPSALENNIHFVRIFPWRWVSKKGIAGNIESGLDVDWVYNWNLDRNSPLDWEYVPIRQTRWWPNLNQDWKVRGATHLLGYNEPDHPDQADITVGDAIGAWPDLLSPGLRVGAPAVTDGGQSWLYDFISRADAAGLRVDFVPVHYYRCHGNAGDPAGTATQFYNFLKGIHDVVKRPLWITEWNNGANWTSCADPTFAQQEAAVSAIIDMLDNTPFVERHAIYNWVEDVRRVKWDDGSLTGAGAQYRNQISPLAYRQEMADAGIGSSARYSFNGHTHDEWGNGQDAMRVGAPVFTAGKSGEAIALNGATDYLQLSPRLGDSGDWSFAGWIYWNGGADWQRVFDFGDDTTHHLFLTPSSSANTLRFGIENGGTQQQLNAPALPAGVWTHVAVTIAGSTGKLFVNGVPVATNTAMTINPDDVGTKFNFLGKSRFAGNPLFSGRFDDFRFISSALTDAGVAAIVSTPPPQFRNSTLHKPDAAAGQPYSASLGGEATGTGTLTFSKMDGPAWLSVSANGALSGTPGTAHGGINNFLVRVTDPNGSINTATLLITVPALTFSITSDADDAEQTAAGAVSLNSTDLELVRDDEAGPGSQIIGLRFAGLGIPRGAIISSATIQFTADESQSEPTVLNISCEAADDSAPLTAGANNIGSRAPIPFGVTWQPGPWTAGQTTAAQLTPNLAGLVQEVTSRPGWTAGNALMFVISGTGHRTAESADKSGGSPPRLIITWSSPAPLLTMTATVNGSANDAEQSAAGAVGLTSTDLELVNDGTLGDQTVGLRFENLALPPGAVIESAGIQFSADEAQTDPAVLTLRAQAADNASIFSAVTNNLTTRPLTGASVAWAPAAWTNVDERGPLQRTPDLSTLVREVIARPGWLSGNAMAFLVTGSGHRTAAAADKVGGLPATLTVTYRTEIPPGTYASWAAGHPNRGAPAADPDADGYQNLLEYALGLNPALSDGAAPPVISNGPWLEFTWIRPAAVTDVVFQVEWADSPGSAIWSGSGITQEVVSDDGTWRTIRSILPKGTTGRRFVRLKVIH